MFLARRGHAVTAVDQSAVGLAKARTLAARHGVVLTTVTADLGTFAIRPGAWAGIVATFVHLPPALRARVRIRWFTRAACTIIIGPLCIHQRFA